MKIITIFLLIFFLFLNVIYTQTPVYYSGYPIIVDSARSPFQKPGVPIVTDLDKNGSKELIFYLVVYEGTANPPGMLYVVNNDGSAYTNFPKGYNELIYDISSGDVDGDGYLDIAIRLMNSIDVLDRFGNHLPGFPVDYFGNDAVNPKSINLYDLENDGNLEIIVTKIREISVFNSNGVLRTGWPRFFTGISFTNPAIGDIDNDGRAEIVLSTVKIIPTGGADSSALRIYMENGDNFSTAWPIYCDSGYYNWGASPSLVINNHNSDSSYILMSSLIDLNVQTGLTRNRLTKYNTSAKIINKGFSELITGLGTLVIGDLDFDGNPEFTNGSQGSPTTLNLYSDNLNIYPGWPNQGVGEHYATPVIGKLSNSNELIICDNNWEATNPNGFGNIFAYNKDGSSLPWSPLRPIGLVKGVALADINNDGSVELIAISSKTLREAYLHIWTIPGIPFSHKDFPWPMYGHDRYRTNQLGFIPPDEPVGIQPTSTNIPEKFSLFQNYPNPFNPATTIKFDIKNSAFTKLSVFDILGREIQILVNEELKTGSYSLVFDGSEYNSGVYFYRLSSGDFTETKRMLLIK